MGHDLSCRVSQNYLRDIFLQILAFKMFSNLIFGFFSMKLLLFYSKLYYVHITFLVFKKRKLRSSKNNEREKNYV